MKTSSGNKWYFAVMVVPGPPCFINITQSRIWPHLGPWDTVFIARVSGKVCKCVHHQVNLNPVMRLVQLWCSWRRLHQLGCADIRANPPGTRASHAQPGHQPAPATGLHLQAPVHCSLPGGNRDICNTHSLDHSTFHSTAMSSCPKPEAEAQTPYVQLCKV